MTIVLVLLALALLRIVVVLGGVALLIRPVSACPACGHDTVAIRRALLRFSRRYEWRWCSACRWEGVARRSTGRSGAAERSRPRQPGFPRS